jgi:uncharacterized membrane protein YkvA (DUF1232 family)
MAKNIFFDLALKKASRLFGKPGRVVMLIAALTQKLKNVKLQNVNAADVKEKFFTLGRMIKAYSTGKYRDIPWKTLLLIAAAVIYFVNPFDLIPDVIPALGLTDDLGVLMMVYKATQGEVDKFLAWERTMLPAANP